MILDLGSRSQSPRYTHTYTGGEQPLGSSRHHVGVPVLVIDSGLLNHLVVGGNYPYDRLMDSLIS